MLRASVAYTVGFFVVMAGCAHDSGPKLVSDADFGRLSPDQTQPVRQARDEQQAVREELARAKLNLQQAHQQQQLARADEPAAKADAERAKALADAANQSREPEALQRAAAMKDRATAHLRAAHARSEWATQLVRAAEARVGAAEKHLAMVDARVDYSRLLALQQANVPAATKYDGNELQKRVEERHQAWLDARRKADDAAAKAQTLLAQSRDAAAQFRAEVPGVPAPGTSTGTSTGTGSR